jgi:hypothetical protein
MPNRNSTTITAAYCCGTCGASVSLERINADDLAYCCQNRRCQRFISAACTETLGRCELLELPTRTAKWSYEQLSVAFEIVFADLTDDIIDGRAPALSDDQMAEINITWAEVLASARWTYRQWSKALDRGAQYAA